MSATLARSDVLRPLSWFLGLLGLATLGMVTAKGPEWLIASFGACFLLAALLYAYSYLFCLHRNPDGLRSEKYSLNKMAIEHAAASQDFPIRSPGDLIEQGPKDG